MFKSKLLIIAAVVMAIIGAGYCILPADFINDLIPLIGLLDDLVINLITLTGMVGSIVAAISMNARPAAATYNEYDYDGYGDYYEQ